MSFFLDDPFHHSCLSYGILIFFQILLYEVQSDFGEYLSSKVKPPTKTWTKLHVIIVMTKLKKQTPWNI